MPRQNKKVKEKVVKLVKKKTISKSKAASIKKNDQKITSKVVRINVVKSNYLDHYVSPHLVDLSEFSPKPKKQPIFFDEPVASYFSPKEKESAAKESVVSENDLLSPVEPSMQQISLDNLDEPVLDRINKIRQEIAKFEATEPEIVVLPELPIAEEVLTPTVAEDIFEGIDDEVNAFEPLPFIIKKESLALPEIKPVPEVVVSKKIKAPKNKLFLTKRIVVFLGNGTDRIVQPLRNIPLSLPAKAMIGFVVMALFFVLPLGIASYYQNLKGKENGILGFARAAAQNLSSAGGAIEEKDLTGADQKFDEAYKNFSEAEAELRGINKVVTAIASILPQTDKTMTTASALLDSGKRLAVVGQNLTRGLSALENASFTIADKVNALRGTLEAIGPDVEKINQALALVDVNVLPAEEQVKFIELKQKMPAVAAGFKNFVKVSEFAEGVLGRNELKRYLLVFQNNSEVRPTGGFIGSFALVDMVNGEIKNLEIPGGGSYDLQGSLKVAVAAPAPLHLVKEKWEFQDSNWFSDWPTAAQKMAWFYNQSGGPTVDGVIAINADLIQNILQVIGPVTVGDKQIDAENFFGTVQTAVEVDYDKEKNQPKEFIGKMTPEVLARMLSADKDQIVKIISLLSLALDAKDLQMYFFNPTTESSLAELGWDNKTRQTDGDYLKIVNANIAGQKTDKVIDQTIFHEASIAADGTVRDKVTIARSHHGVPGEPFYGVRNINYLRLYVPLGSKLISATGFQPPASELFKNSADYQQDQDLLRISGLTKTDEVTGLKVNQEFNKTVFGGWTQVYPGKTQISTIEYELPFKVSFTKYDTGFTWLNKLEEGLNLTEATTNYSLVAEKQSGQTSEFYSLVDFPKDWKELWRYPEQNLTVATGSSRYANYLDRDRIYSIIFQR